MIDLYKKSKSTLDEKLIVPISDELKNFIKKCWNFKGDGYVKHKRPNTQKQGDGYVKHKRPNTQTGMTILRNEVSLQKSYRLTGNSSLIQTVKYVDKSVDYTDHVFLGSKMAHLTRQFIRFKIVNNRMVKDIEELKNQDSKKNRQPIKRKLVVCRKNGNSDC